MIIFSESIVELWYIIMCKSTYAHIHRHMHVYVYAHTQSVHIEISGFVRLLEAPKLTRTFRVQSRIQTQA